MTTSNATAVTEFVLLGLPGLHPEYHGPVSALFLTMYLLIVIGNIFILAFIANEYSLQKPTYILFCHLAMTDIAFGTVTLPRIIYVYWLGYNLISFYGCFAQMYFVHFLGATHSFILMIMALDRFVAICVPLRYPVLISNNTISICCGISWFMPCSWMIAVIFHALSYRYCNSNVIAHCYCDRISIVTLAAEKNKYIEEVAFGLAMFSLLVPLAFIVISYFFIILAVMKISNSEGRYKAFSTCTPQLLIMSIYYLPRCFVYLAYTVGFTLRLDISVIVIMLYSVLPAALNPIIYCFKTREIKETFMRRLKKLKSGGVVKNVRS